MNLCYKSHWFNIEGCFFILLVSKSTFFILKHICFVQLSIHEFSSLVDMITSSNGNIVRVTGPLCGEFTGRRWIPRTQKPVTRSFDVFFHLCLKRQLSKQWRRWWFESYRAHYDIIVLHVVDSLYLNNVGQIVESLIVLDIFLARNCYRPSYPYICIPLRSLCTYWN